MRKLGHIKEPDLRTFRDLRVAEDRTILGWGEVMRLLTVTTEPGRGQNQVNQECTLLGMVTEWTAPGTVRNVTLTGFYLRKGSTWLTAGEGQRWPPHCAIS